MKITSSAFNSGEEIPVKFSRLGENINPPLSISEVPTNAQSLVLIVNDPDAPGGTWIHWLLWNIAPDTQEIEENSVPEGAVQGKTSRENSYGGPNPPSGTHRYFFKLFALNKKITLAPQANISELEQAIKDHILDQAELMGTFSAR